MQNLIKSFFISLFPLFCLAGVFFATNYFLNNSFSYQVFGNFMSCLGPVLFFALLFIFKRPRTDENLKAYSSFTFSGVLISLYGYLTESMNVTSTLFLLGAVLGWVAYLRWYSVFGKREDNQALQLGSKLPEFYLEDISKKRVSSSSFIGKAGVFLFYRGNWCPLCMAQIKEIAQEYKELKKLGVETYLISPQPHKYSRNLAEKYDVGFHFLVDKGNEAAKKLQLLAKSSLPMGFQVFGYDNDTVLPTVIITDKTGKIIFLDLTDNYRVRPEPSTFLEILKQNEG